MKFKHLFSGITLFFLSLSTLSAQSTESIIQTIPFSQFIPCANDGAGEMATGEIVLHQVIHYDANGTITKFLAHPQNTNMVGQSTGTVYKGTGASAEAIQVNGTTIAYTYTSMYQFIGIGGGARYRERIIFHGTQNANGEIVSWVDTEIISCKP